MILLFISSLNFTIMLLTILILAGLVYLKMSGKVNISWTVIVIAAALLLFTGVFSNITNLFAPKDIGSTADSPLERDACGCGPGQQVAMTHRNFWGNSKPAGVTTCATALAREQRSGKWRRTGCVN